MEGVEQDWNLSKDPFFKLSVIWPVSQFLERSHLQGFTLFDLTQSSLGMFVKMISRNFSLTSQLSDVVITVGYKQTNQKT